MTEKQRFEANEQRDKLFAAAEWRSVVSGEPLRSGVPMLAHRVAKTVAALRIWGPEVINHPLNLVPVRDLKENDLCNIGNQKVKANALLERIVRIQTGRESMPDLGDYYRAVGQEVRAKRG